VVSYCALLLVVAKQTLAVSLKTMQYFRWQCTKLTYDILVHQLIPDFKFSRIDKILKLVMILWIAREMTKVTSCLSKTPNILHTLFVESSGH